MKHQVQKFACSNAETLGNTVTDPTRKHGGHTHHMATIIYINSSEGASEDAEALTNARTEEAFHPFSSVLVPLNPKLCFCCALPPLHGKVDRSHKIVHMRGWLVPLQASHVMVQKVKDKIRPISQSFAPLTSVFAGSCQDVSNMAQALDLRADCFAKALCQQLRLHLPQRLWG